MSIQNPTLLEERAKDHWGTAQRLAESNDEWAAVAGFYSCYQLARAALIQDPVFSDLRTLKSIHQNLTPDDRFETKHKIRGGPRATGFGVIDLVHAIFPHAGGIYETIHRGSCDVRYEDGLKRPKTLASMIGLCELFRTEYGAGRLVHTESLRCDRLTT